MSTTIPTQELVQFDSHFSFRPLIRAWEDIIQTGREGFSQLYAGLLEKVKQHPALLERITDENVLLQHRDIINQMMATVFPVTFSDKEDMYAIGFPFQYKVLYASSMFRNLFLDDSNHVVLPDIESVEKLQQEKIAGAYQLILNRLYDIKIDGCVTTVHPFKCPTSGLDRFMEVSLDTRFIDVVPKKPLPELPPNWRRQCARITDIFSIPGLEQFLPLDDFEFEGLVIIYIREVTGREVMDKIKNSLLNIHSFADRSVFTELQKQIRNLMGVDGVHTAIKPFFRVNNHLVLTEMMTSSGNDQQDKDVPMEKKQEMYRQILAAFRQSPEILLVNDLDEDIMSRYRFLVMMHERGFRNSIICPLFLEDKHLAGVLIIASPQPGVLTAEHVARIEPAIPLFTLALEKSQEHLDHQVDRVIKEQFTAVQDAVEWRFTEAALNYLTKKDKGEQTKIESISFDGVYPLYGAIDIRNSSVERNNAIQLDMLEQLAGASKIVEQARTHSSFPLLEEVQYRIERYTHSVTNILFAEEEQAIHHFLVDEIVQLFKHLQLIIPGLENDIREYMQSIDSPVKMVYHHRRDYEDSITTINNEVARLVDFEQKAAQEIYPHYFERFVTDGLDFNIYIGQSISPEKPYDPFYLRNLKIWQLTTLVKAARLTQSLQSRLSLPLETTQLILAHSHPISISFRTAERKFDVDGAYNIRYEIIKKRIDKVHIRDSHERLTKPGTIAIVYSQPREAEEYTAYIEYLQQKGFLDEEIERYDLEELQGVVGLRGLRVRVKTDVPVEKIAPAAAPQSKVSTTDLAAL
jgi:GAF domain-containing protein